MDAIAIDTIVFNRLVWATLAATILCLDRIVFQTMLSRPIVIAPIIGLILGNVLTGLFVGAVIELFWCNKAPLGTYLPPNDSIVAAVSTLTVIPMVQNMPRIHQEMIALCILFYLPLGFLGQKLEAQIARFNEGLSEKALKQIESTDGSFEPPTPTLPIMVYFLYTFSMITLPLIFGLIYIPPFYDALPQAAERALFYSYYALPLIGVAAVLTTTQHRKTLLYFSTVFLISVLTLEILRKT
ncbi:MAG: PTS sugar transporter subunit IIC [Deltaproteobacteria bacterium]|nr:PTS sugar transporter subunit IIC [Deltaproteobacteria bacterium]